MLRIVAKANLNDGIHHFIIQFGTSQFFLKCMSKGRDQYPIHQMYVIASDTKNKTHYLKLNPLLKSSDDSYLRRVLGETLRASINAAQKRVTPKDILTNTAKIAFLSIRSSLWNNDPIQFSVEPKNNNVRKIHTRYKNKKDHVTRWSYIRNSYDALTQMSNRAVIAYYSATDTYVIVVRHGKEDYTTEVKFDSEVSGLSIIAIPNPNTTFSITIHKELGVDVGDPSRILYTIGECVAAGCVDGMDISGMLDYRVAAMQIGQCVAEHINAAIKFHNAVTEIFNEGIKGL